MTNDEYMAISRRQREAYIAWQNEPAGPGWVPALEAYRAASADLDRANAEIERDRLAEAKRQSRLRKADFIAYVTNRPVWTVLADLK